MNLHTYLPSYHAAPWAYLPTYYIWCREPTYLAAIQSTMSPTYLAAVCSMMSPPTYLLYAARWVADEQMHRNVNPSEWNWCGSAQRHSYLKLLLVKLRLNRRSLPLLTKLLKILLSHFDRITCCIIYWRPSECRLKEKLSKDNRKSRLAMWHNQTAERLDAVGFHYYIKPPNKFSGDNQLAYEPLLYLNIIKLCIPFSCKFSPTYLVAWEGSYIQYVYPPPMHSCRFRWGKRSTAALSVYVRK